jgi:DNA-binding response OmpR family regulator
MRLLLTEDGEKVSRFIVKGQMAERFAVDVAAEGDKGLEPARAYNYDLIILDLALPGLSGTEAMRLVRRQNEHAPVMVLTARDGVTDFDGATNIVDVYVRRLRNKIDEPFERKLIRTVRGVGYSIGGEEGL